MAYGRRSGSSSLEDCLKTTEEKTNFTRLTRLLISGGTTVMREVFDSIIIPSKLVTELNASKTTLQALRTRKILTRAQWDTLFPPSGTIVESKSFDITLLFTLLREVCGLSPPATGWDILPNEADISREADLARIKYYRNTIYAHVNENMELSDNDFQTYSKDIKEAMVRLSIDASGIAKASEFEKAINNYLAAPLTVEDKVNTKLLKSWYLENKEVQQIQMDNTTQRQKCCEGSENKGHHKDKYDIILKAVVRLGCVGTWATGSAYILHRYKDDPKTFLEMVHGFVLPVGVLVLGFTIGSIKIKIRVENLAGLEEFWSRYQTGQLKEDLEEFFMFEELKEFAGDDIVELELHVSEEEYKRIRHHFLQETPQKTSQTTPQTTPQTTVQKKLQATFKKEPLEKPLKKTQKAIQKSQKEKGSESQQKDTKTEEKDEATETSISAWKISEEDTPDIGEYHFIRLARLLCVGITILRELFDSIFPEKDLARKLKEPTVFKILSQMRGTQLTDYQWDTLFPDPRSQYLVESKSFDMDLLFKLLQEICEITPPLGTGWNYQPDPKDNSLGSQIARITWYRVGIYSYVSKYDQLTDKTFHMYWTNVKVALLRIVEHYDVSKVKAYRMVIDNLLSAPISGYPDINVRCSLLVTSGAASMGISFFIRKMLSNPKIFMKMEHVFPIGLLVVNISKGSIKIVLWATEVNALETFWRRYKTGKLKKDLMRVMITGDIKKMTTGCKVQMSISVNEKDYEDARENLLSYTAFEPQGFTQEEAWDSEKPEEFAASMELKERKPLYVSEVPEAQIKIWHGEPIEDRTSIFQAHLAVITSRKQVLTVFAELKIQQKKAISDVAFVVWAYRIGNNETKFYAERNVGTYEYFAGRRVFKLLQEEDAKDVILIVTCWQGDVPALGMDTYDNISSCARILLQSFLYSSKSKADDSTSK